MERASFREEFGIRCCRIHDHELRNNGGLNSVRLTEDGTKVQVYMTPDSKRGPSFLVQLFSLFVRYFPFAVIITSLVCFKYILVYYPLELGNYAPLRLAIGADYQRKASVLYAQEGGFRDNIHRRLWSNVGRTSSMAHRSRGKKELGVSLHMANYYSRVADIVRLESMVHGLFKTEGLWVEPGTAGNTTRHNELFAIDKDTVLRYVVQAVRFMKVFFPSSVQDFVDGLRIFMDIRL